MRAPSPITRLAWPALALAFLASPRAAYAQGFELGGWAAANWSTERTTAITLCNARGCFPSWSSPSSSATRRALAAAMTTRLALTDRIALRAELAAVPKGYTPPTHPYVTALYVEAPVLVELAYLRLGDIALTAAAGLAPARLVSCSVSAETAQGFRRTGCQDDWRHSREASPRILGPRASDLGAVAGLGARAPLGHGTAFIELRHVRGLTDTNPSEHGRTHNLTYAVAAGYTVAVGRGGAPGSDPGA